MGRTGKEVKRKDEKEDGSLNLIANHYKYAKNTHRKMDGSRYPLNETASR